MPTRTSFFGPLPIFFGTFLSGLPLEALAWGDPTQVYLAYGQARFGGNLEISAGSLSTIGLHSRKIPERRIPMMGSLQRTRVGIGIDLVRGRTEVTSTSFPLANNQNLNVTLAALTPTTCYFTQESLKVCLGLGIASLGLKTRSSSLHYSSFNTQLDLHYEWAGGYFLKAWGRHTGPVRQRYEAVTSTLWLDSYGIGMGFTYH